MNQDVISSKTIANNIRAERNRAGFTQTKTAELLNITVKTYIAYEADARNVKPTTLYMLSRIFNCTIDAFYLQQKSTKRENDIKQKV